MTTLIIKAYAVAWSLSLSAMWMATDDPAHPSLGWPVSLLVLGLTARYALSL